MAARVAEPLPDVGRQVGPSVHEDVALPSLPLTHLIEDRDAARGLHDPAEPPGIAGKHRQSRAKAPLSIRTVLRTLGAVHAGRIIAKRRVVKPRRASRI